ncbi:MAG: hypothetical protein ACTSRA_02170 [Promethearchaeota archaeon]
MDSISPRRNSSRIIGYVTFSIVPGGAVSINIKHQAEHAGLLYQMPSPKQTPLRAMSNTRSIERTPQPKPDERRPQALEAKVRSLESQLYLLTYPR